MEPSPYQPPQSHIVYRDPLSGTRPVPVRRLVRFANFILDYIGNTAFGFVVGLIAGVTQSQGLIDFIVDYNLLFGVILMIVYYIALEAAFGRTLGKMITGTRVVNENGDKPTFGQVVGRTFARFIPFEALSCLTEDGRGWHDSLSKTYVVKNSPGN
ncbi:MAG: hypothetical protein RL088_565 [Verrucomicrobiota bacterium]